MKIIVDDAIPFIKERIKGNHEIEYLSSQDINNEVVKHADVLIVRTRTQCNKDLLENSKVKLILTATIGTDHIALEWCKGQGIEVVNAAGCNAPGVAQYVLSALLREGFNVEKHILGIIGFGNVGSLVGEWAERLGIKILVSDPPRSDAGYNDIEYVSPDYLLKRSDAVTLHVPLTDNGKYPTLSLIGKKEIELMKSGAILINSSRGGVVDEKYLKSGIKEKKIRAITDVWVNEPNPDAGLVGMCEISTPHIAGYSFEGKQRATRMVLEALKNTLNVDVDLQGLECEPKERKDIDRDLLMNSYNPFNDSRLLKGNIEAFESLRNNYRYRHEPLFME